jgi:hypothetical protein
MMRIGIIGANGERVPINATNCEEVGGFKLLDLPPEIPRSRRSPLRIELSWLHNELSKMGPMKRVLEFSGGITTWMAYDAIKPRKYVCVEAKRFKGIFNPVLEYYPNIEVVHSWPDIPNKIYDLVFIDGSSCMTKELIKKYKPTDAVRRREALMYSEQFMRVGSHVVFHDWGHRSRRRGWRLLRRYCEESENFEFVKAFKCHRKGFGIFKKVK